MQIIIIQNFITGINGRQEKKIREVPVDRTVNSLTLETFVKIDVELFPVIIYL